MNDLLDDLYNRQKESEIEFENCQDSTESDYSLYWVGEINLLKELILQIESGKYNKC